MWMDFLPISDSSTSCTASLVDESTEFQNLLQFLLGGVIVLSGPHQRDGIFVILKIVRSFCGVGFKKIVHQRRLVWSVVAFFRK